MIVADKPAVEALTDAQDVYYLFWELHDEAPTEAAQDRLDALENQVYRDMARGTFSTRAELLARAEAVIREAA